MSRRNITVRIDRADFTHEEHFLSKVDAEHWRQMMEETLRQPELIIGDLEAHAAGLARTVRAHGGPATREAWLSDRKTGMLVALIGTDRVLGRVPVRHQHLSAECVFTYPARST